MLNRVYFNPIKLNILKPVGSGIVSMTSGGGSLLMILIQVGTGVVLYLVIAVVLKMESLRYLVETAKLYLPY